MLDWTITNQRDGTKHYVVVNNTTNILRVTRVQQNGGTPITIELEVKQDDTYLNTVKRVEKLCKLDNELYKLLSEHTIK